MPHEKDNLHLVQQKIRRGREKAEFLGEFEELTSDEVFRRAISALESQWHDGNSDNLSCSTDYQDYNDLDICLEIISDLRWFTRYMNEGKLAEIEDDPDLAWLLPFWNAEPDEDHDDEEESEE